METRGIDVPVKTGVVGVLIVFSDYKSDYFGVNLVAENEEALLLTDYGHVNSIVWVVSPLEVHSIF